MKIFDGHCDTLSKLLDKQEKCQEKSIGNLKENDFNLDFNRMGKYQSYIQVFAAFVDKKEIKVSPFKHCVKLAEKWKEEVEKNNVMPITCAEHLNFAEDNDGSYAMLAIEGGEALEGKLSNIDVFFEMGVRLITLTWNYANEIADGAGEGRGAGLTDFGYDVVRCLEEKGIMTDVSHLSEKGFWDVMECSRKPFVASHSSARALCEHKRNLTDKQLKAMGERGCVAGANFYPNFINNNGICNADDICNRIVHMLNMGGEDLPGLGSDFDGIDTMPADIKGVQDMEKFPHILKRKGISERIIDKVMYKNFVRVFKDVI